MPNKWSPAKKFILARALASAYFWGSISIPYLAWRGFSIAEAFALIGIYSFLVVILEFPTGVIGDYYGHKLSINLANILGALSMFIMSLPLPHYAYYLLILLAALSASLVSGSDTAYLHSLSTNFKKDLAKIRTTSTLVAMITLASAGYIALIDFRIPLYLTSATWLLSTAIILFLPNPTTSRKDSGNIFAQASQSISYVIKSIPILAIMVYITVNNGYALSIKTVINSFGSSLHFDLGQIGLLVGLSFAFRALGFFFSKHANSIKTRHLFITLALLFTTITLITPSYLSLFLLASTSALTAIISLRADYAINDLIPNHLRASILSLKGLVVRLFSSGYLIIAGFLLDSNLFQILMLITLILYTITGTIFIRLSRINNAK